MTTLEFTKLSIDCAPLGPKAPMPDLMGISNVQNHTSFDLGEEDEIYEGYGQRPNGYPYRLYTEYTRRLAPAQVDAAVLENDLMRAVFLPGYGGRLWQLTDKLHSREVLYTNDVLRASNLAVLGAWFSGGVEWNMGIVGHTPLTMDRIFAARVEGEKGPVLRMYGYERVRGAVYQMDFWLDESTPALNCHMSVTNPTAEMIPMYWWSNIASPLYPGGRLFVPAHKAFTFDKGTIRKVSVPMDGQVDVSRYEQIPLQKDYFFDLDKGAPRWLAHVDAQGCGLLHTSTARLQSRKLFVWGNTTGADHWQQFLTRNAGPYLEVQAGLGKTQYGCIPMAPHTTWQWTERYQPIDLAAPVDTLDFDETCHKISASHAVACLPDELDAVGRSLRLLPAQVMLRGNGDAQLENLARAKQGLAPMTPHLDFAGEDDRQQLWTEFLENGVIPAPEAELPPAYDLTGSFWLHTLRREAQEQRGNWFIHYMLGLLEAEAGRKDLAMLQLELSLKGQPSAWAWYAEAVLLGKAGRVQESAQAAKNALALYPGDAAFAKACLLLLANAEDWQDIRKLIASMPEELQQVPRIRFFMARALYHMGEYRHTMDILEENGGMELDDTRECEVAVGQLWQMTMKALTGEEHEVPFRMQFDCGAMPPELLDRV